MYYMYQKLSKNSVHNWQKIKNHTKCSQIYREENVQIWQTRTPHTLYLAPFLSFAVQTKRNTFFPFSLSSFEESFRPIAKEARAGLLAFRTLWEAAIRFTIDISQFIRILVFSDENTSKRITFNNLPLSLPPYFDSNHVLTFDQSLVIRSLEPAIRFESLQLTLTNLRFLLRSNSLVFPHISLSNMASMEIPNTVFVQITSSVTSFTSEKRLQRNETISLLKVCSNRKLLIFSERKLRLNYNKIALYVTLLWIVVTSVVFVDVCLYTKRFRSWKQITKWLI